MQHFIQLITPGYHLHLQKKWFWGDFINLLAAIAIALATFLYYTNHPKESFYPFIFFFSLLILNIWKIKQFKDKSNNPAYIKLQEIEFKEIISNFLLGNHELATKNLKKMVANSPCPQELEIFLLYLNQKQNNQNEIKRLKANIQSQPLSTTAKSLLYSISK
jgi:hypothetical protein